MNNVKNRTYLLIASKFTAFKAISFNMQSDSFSSASVCVNSFAASFSPNAFANATNFP